MIPYADLEKALARWKSRSASPPPLPPAAHGEAAPPAEAGERKRFKSSLDWSMDQAMGTSPEAAASDTSEIPVAAIIEESSTSEFQPSDAAAAPSQEAGGESTSEIDVTDIEDES